MAPTSHKSDWDVSDDIWQKLRPLLPEHDTHPKGGRPPASDRRVLGAILQVLRTGIPWKALPRDIGAPSTVYDRFRRWEEDGFFLRVWDQGLHAHPELAELDWHHMSPAGVMTCSWARTSFRRGTLPSSLSQRSAPQSGPTGHLAVSILEPPTDQPPTDRDRPSTRQYPPTAFRSTHPSERLVARKLETPQLPAHHVVRDRLIAKVEQCLGTARTFAHVLLMSAPAGYGKTTLLAQWAHHTSIPVAWYHVDSGDNDPASFLHGIVAALRTRHIHGFWHVQSFLHHLADATLSSTEITRASALLIADIAQHVTCPTALVMTGIGELESTSPTFEILDQILARQRDNLRIALEFRDIPQASFARLVTQHRIEGIGRHELCFTDEESNQLLDLIEAPEDSSYRTQVKDLCTGWVTGILLSTRTLWPRQLVSVSEDIDRAAVFQYLVHEVIDSLPHALRKFASQAAVLTHMTPALCAELLHIPVREARGYLGSLERHAAFVTRSSGRSPHEVTYRFQPLLREALLDQLDASNQEFGSNHRQILHLRAGHLLAKEGDTEQAIWQYTQATAFAEIADLIAQTRDALLDTGQGLRLVRWLDLVPPAMREQRPELQLLLADLWRQAGQGQSALVAVEPVCALFESPESPPQAQLAAEASLTRGRTRYTLGFYEEARADYHRALTFLALAQSGGLDVGGLYAQTYDSLATTTAHLNGANAAEPLLRFCEHYYLRHGPVRELGRHQYRRSNLYIQQGNYRLAQQAATTALLAAQETHDEISAICSHLNLGAVKLRTRRLLEAQIDFDAALSQAEAIQYPIGTGYALSNLADLAVCLGHYTKAIELYERVILHVSKHPVAHLRACAYSGLGIALSLSGQSSQAVVRLTTAVDEQRTTGGSSQTLNEIILALAMGFAYYSCGMPILAEDMLAETAQVAQHQGFVLEAAQAFIFLAAVSLQQRQPVLASNYVQNALNAAAQAADPASIAIELLYVPSVWPILEQSDHAIAPLLREALTELLAYVDEHPQSLARRTSACGILANEQASWSVGQVESVEPVAPSGRSVLGRNGSRDGSRAVQRARACPLPQPPVRVYMLGEARILVGTHYINYWRKPAARDVLLFLLHQGRPVTRLSIITALWPDADPSQATTWLSSACYHLKRVLGQDSLVRLGQGRLGLGQEFWVDVDQFERHIREGQSLVEKANLTDAARAFEQALTYWNGPYLSDILDDWPLGRRAEMAQAKHDCLIQLATLEYRIGERSQAAQHFHHVLESEPLSEQAHRGLMHCYAASGEIARAIRQYDHCAATLREELGVDPDPSTVALYHKLRAKLHDPVEALVASRIMAP